ncbi:hypothetical protein ATO6_01645 [Oceanicola sp. 22II-s10i]|uniref:hypothetical protein n=1 Tax=Oceanicola sp. 22II-s10i TaxID=1317116 RepID=UPI000B52947F|nr:hypothetical protein [Oceanicola sp. 22II-s10i]OWU85659.1 hypothetical protein ATO6_01645 [Oceanicola sp. 22II-s10i]
MTDFHTDRPVSAALAALVLLQLVMLGALYAGVPPHPPQATPVFGIAPFLGAAVAACAASLVLGTGTRAGRGLAGLAALMALASFGPQKYLDAQFPLIWPAVIAAQISVLTIGYRLVRAPAPDGRANAARLAA